jgi:hypothetical protein
MILAVAVSLALGAAVASCSSPRSPSASHIASAASSASAASTAAAVVQIKANWEAFFSGTTPAVAAGYTAFGDGLHAALYLSAGLALTAGLVAFITLRSRPAAISTSPLMPGDRETGQP